MEDLRIPKVRGNELPERTLKFCEQNAVNLSEGPTFEERCGIENVRNRNRRQAKRRGEVAGYTTGIEGLRGGAIGLAGPKGEGAQQLRPVRLARTQTHGSPTDSSARFQTAAPGRRSADWKFHHDRHQPKAGAATPRRSSPSPLRLPWRPDTHKLHLPPRSQLESRRQLHARGGRPAGPDLRPPTGLRRGSSRGATGPRGGRAEPTSLRVCPGTRPRDHLRLAPRARPDPAPTHPSRAVSGRARTRASLLPPPLLLPIFSPRLVDVPVGAASHFAPFVLKQILHPLPLRRQLRLEIIIHCLLSP